MLALIKRITNIRDFRYKQAMRTTYISFLAQGIYMITAVLSVPLVLNALGSERYGLWMTLSSTLLFITFTDFGMGIGMQNLISYANAHKDNESIKKSLTTTLTFGFLLFSVLCISALFILPIFDLSSWFKYKDKSISSEILPATQAVFFVLAFGILSGLVQRAFESFQQGYYPKIILIIARVLSLIFLYWSIATHKGIFVIIFALNGLPNVILFLGILYFYHRYPNLTFRIKDIDLRVFKKIFKTGIVGLGASIAIYLVSSIAPFIISSTYGLAESSKYLILNKLLNFVFLLFNIILLPFWPAVADAYSKNDFLWLNSLYKRVITLTIWAGGPIFIVLLFTSKWIIYLWAGDASILPSFPLILVNIIFSFLSLWNMVTCVFLNGMSQFRGQATFGILIAFVSISFAYLIRSYTNTTGILVVITIGMLIRCIFLHFELRRKMGLNKRAIIVGEIFE